MNETIKKNGITFGIISGVISILIATVIYIIDLELFTSMWVALISIITYITISCILLSKTKKELNGQFTFKQAFTTYFIAAVIGIVISVFFNIVLFNFIDPSLKDSIKELTIKSTVQMMEKFGAKAADITKTIKNLEESDQFGIAQQLKGIIFNILFSSILGLILAAIFKSKSSYQQ